MATFGITDAAGYSAVAMASGVIRGTVYSCPAIGILKKLTGYLDPTADGPLKLLLYRHSDLKLIAVSEERSLLAADGLDWYDFTCGDEGLTAVDYIPVVFSGAGVNGYRKAGAVNIHHLQTAVVYPNAPDPLAPAHQSYDFAVHATYELVDGGSTFKRRTCSKLMMGL